MPRKPELGNVQVYPNRPLTKADKTGYVLQFYCPIRGKRIRRSCGTRDRREARKVMRECSKRLLDGSYVQSGGATTALDEQSRPVVGVAVASDAKPELEEEDMGMVLPKVPPLPYRPHQERLVQAFSVSTGNRRTNFPRLLR